MEWPFRVELSVKKHGHSMSSSIKEKVLITIDRTWSGHVSPGRKHSTPCPGHHSRKKGQAHGVAVNYYTFVNMRSCRTQNL
jgi:hypothetical protein